MSETPTLLCMDIQRACLRRGHPMWTPHGVARLGAVHRMREFARRNRWRVAHTFLRRGGERLNVDVEAARPIEGFEPAISEAVFVRSGLSAYSHAAFAGFMGDAEQAPVIIATLNGCLSLAPTLFDAFAFNHRLTVAHALIACPGGPRLNADAHELAVLDLATRLEMATGLDQSQLFPPGLSAASSAETTRLIEGP